MEPRPRFLQLPRMRPVLGVVYDEIFAAGGLKRVGKRLGFRSRQPRRHLDDLVVRPEMETAQGAERLGVIGLADQLDVEAGVRPIELVEHRNELWRDCGLPVKGDEDRIDGTGHRGSGKGGRRLARLGAEERCQADGKGGKENRRQHKMQRQDCDEGGEDERDQRQADASPRIKSLPSPEGQPGAEFGRGVEQTIDGVAQPAPASGAPDGPADRFGRGRGHHVTHLRPSGKHVLQAANTGCGRHDRHDRRPGLRGHAHHLRLQQLAVDAVHVDDPPGVDFRHEGQSEHFGERLVIGGRTGRSRGEKLGLERGVVAGGPEQHFGDQRLAEAEPAEDFRLVEELRPDEGRRRRHGGNIGRNRDCGGKGCLIGIVCQSHVACAASS